jgi:uncharacterized protein (DUF433 family)
MRNLWRPGSGRRRPCRAGLRSEGAHATNLSRTVRFRLNGCAVLSIRGLRIPAATVLRLPAGGRTEAEILADYPHVEQKGIRERLRFAASALESEALLPRSVEISGLRLAHVSSCRV